MTLKNMSLVKQPGRQPNCHCQKHECRGAFRVFRGGMSVLRKLSRQREYHYLLSAAAGLLLAAGRIYAQVEPQPLPGGAKDTGINVLFDSSHQFTFFHHWQCQSALRELGHRVTGNQASLQRALKVGTPMRVRDQSSHAWNIQRAFTTQPAPEFDVAFLYQHGNVQPYLPEEKAALQAFVAGGGGLIIDASLPESPLGRMLEEYGAKLLPEPVKVALVAGQENPGLAADALSAPRRTAELSGDWQAIIGATATRAALAVRSYEKGVIVLIADPQLVRLRIDNKERPNRELLSWAVKRSTRNAKPREDGRRVAWEPSGLGGAFYPENQIEVGGIRVLYADNQLPEIINLAKTRFTEVMALLQKMLPTPPNPGDAYYINLAAGEGGGWAENAVTPKMAGTIAVKPESILSVLAHELAHTMYGPEAADGTPGCRLPPWWSEAHAGWFQRKVIREMGFGEKWPYWPRGLATLDPTLDAVDLAKVEESQMRQAWEKAWMLWSILDARYGPDWYPRWLAHIHKKYHDPKRLLSMDEYILSLSETAGEDVTALFVRFGTTVGPAAMSALPPMGPKK